MFFSIVLFVKSFPSSFPLKNVTRLYQLLRFSLFFFSFALSHFAAPLSLTVDDVRLLIFFSEG